MSILDKAREKLFSAMGVDGASAPALQDADDQPEEDKRLVSWVKDRVEQCRRSSNRVSHEGVWMTNIAYLLGFDSVYYDTQSRSYRPLNTSSAYLKRNRIQANVLLPAAQNRLARMCKVPPRFEVRPNSLSPDDQDGARLALEYLTSVWERQYINKKRITLGMWVQECGHSYVGVFYDDELGEEMKDPVTGDFLGYEGDVRVEVVSAFEVFPDDKAASWEELNWLARAKVRPLDYFIKRYREKGKLVKPEGTWLLSLQNEQRINSLTGIGPATSGVQDNEAKNSAVEVVYYEKPSSEHRNGRMIVTANGVLLSDKELPCKKIPLIKFDDILVAGKYYPESVVTHARPLQQQYNRVLAKRAEWVNKMLVGKYIAEKRHGLIKEALNDRSGEVVLFQHVPQVSPPTAMDVPTMPEYAYKESDDLKNEIYEMFGLSEVSRGQLPSAGLPAAGIQLLQEQDETRIGIEIEQHEHAWAQVGQLIVEYGSEFIKTKRKLKTRTKTGDWQIREFSGEDFKKNTDVTVVRGSTIPTSRSMKRNDIMNAYQTGLLGDPNDPAVREKALGLLEFGDSSMIWRDRALDMAQIQKTIKEIEDGGIPEVNEFDNHMLHFTEKNAYRKSDRFEKLDEQKQHNFITDMEMHLQEMQKMQNPGLFSQEEQVQSQIGNLEAEGEMPPDPGLVQSPELPQNELDVTNAPSVAPEGM